MIFLLSVTVLVGIAYAIMIFIFIDGWHSIREFSLDTVSIEQYPCCSVIVPVRNEEHGIATIINDITKQDYPASFFEIIVVNDHSVDDTMQAIAPYAALPNVHVEELPPGVHGKKAALARGIARARGELIVCVDADCRVGELWLKTIATYYVKAGHAFIIGPVDFVYPQTFFDRLQNLEFVSLSASTAGAAGRGHAFMCNGANLAFKREVFTAHHDPMSGNASSGDDVFFLHCAKRMEGVSVGYLKNRDAIVITRASTSWGEFIDQRVRWAAKAKLYRDADAIRFGLIAFATNLSMIILLIVSFVDANVVFFFLCLLGIKTLVDTILLARVLSFFGKSRLMGYIVLTEILYMFYFMVVALLSLVRTPVWKGRKVKL